MKLAKKIAIVTGAGSIGPGWGNGKATAALFAREGAKVLCSDQDAIRLAKEAKAAGKMIAAWGEAVGVLASAAVVKGVKVTSLPECADALRAAGAKVGTRQVESSGTIITGYDSTVGMRFGKELAQVVSV